MTGLSGPGMEMLARCIERNVDDAAFATNSIIASMEKRIETLERLVVASYDREQMMRERIEWLLGYD